MHATTLPSLCGLAITALAAAASSAAPDAEQAEVSAPFPAGHFQPVLTQTCRLDSSLWNGRAKALITGWIPHCVAKLSDPNLAEGGIDNLVQAGNKNAGRPFKPHVGVPWTNAYVMNTVESICVALMVDPQGDAELVKAQQALRATLDQWLPVLLAAQEQDGYLPASR